MTEDKVITDADVIEEIRKALPLATKIEKGLMGANGFFSGGICADANECKISGTYFTSTSSENLYLKTWGTLIVFNSYYTVQLHVFASGDCPTFIRILIADKWSDWRQISLL